MTKNFIATAANYNYFTLDAIPQNVLSDKWFIDDLQFKESQAQKIQIPETLLNCKNIEVGIFAKVRQQFKNNFKDEIKEHDLFYIDNFYILVFDSKTNFICQLMTVECGPKKQFSLYPLHEVMNLLQKNSSYEQTKTFLEPIKKPNYIGVFTEKKVQSWLTYCAELIQATEDCKLSIENKGNENKLKIENTIKALPGCKVERYNNYTILTTKLFSIDFELQNNGAYLRQKIEFRGNLKDIINLEL